MPSQNGNGFPNIVYAGQNRVVMSRHGFHQVLVFQIAAGQGDRLGLVDHSHMALGGSGVVFRKGADLVSGQHHCAVQGLHPSFEQGHPL